MEPHRLPQGLPDLPPQLPQEKISRITRKWLDVVYAPTSPAQRLDLYLPEEGDGPFPMVVYVHGGGFAVGDKRDLPVEPFLSVLARGYALASLNYRLSVEAVFPAGLQDVKAAIRWLRAHAPEHRLDPGRIAVAGASSGGNYAAMLCVTAGNPMFDDPDLGNEDQTSAVQVGVDWFGPTDFLKMDQQSEANGLSFLDHSGPHSPESVYLGAHITRVPDRVALANPMTYVGEDMAPLLIQHGSLDHVVPVQQSVEFAQLVEQRLGPGRVVLDILEGAGHSDPMFETQENMARVFGFMERHLM